MLIQQIRHPSLSSENIHFQQILNIYSPMKRNHSLLEYTRDNDTQVSELGPSGPSCCKYSFKYIRSRFISQYVYYFIIMYLRACISRIKGIGYRFLREAIAFPFLLKTGLL